MSSLKGLNDRVELLDQLRFYLRYEQQLLEEGWLSESDFIETVEEIIREYAAKLDSEE